MLKHFLATTSLIGAVAYPTAVPSAPAEQVPVSCAPYVSCEKANEVALNSLAQESETVATLSAQLDRLASRGWTVAEADRIDKEEEERMEREYAEEHKALEAEQEGQTAPPTDNTEQTAIPTESSTYAVGTFDATHYSAYCSTCGQWGGITATGDDISSSIYVRGHRVIAVDPSVIPLGSLVRVYGNGYDFTALALDTGGDIIGNRVDILVGSESEAYAIGRFGVNIEIIN